MLFFILYLQNECSKLLNTLLFLKAIKILVLFLVQVDLKSFGNWEDSPEKMMMDMVSDPNRPHREER